ncbi:hypothetical protein OG874_37640 [Nocardia sp. NBC_00565]|uniref:hypothetical protein n=1 Tax=Nocardia sp. NBC_00565 TaxID=2975993 RepID=UPI002E81D229|nr:hypothetical protein [Nocardia sp. NBC_00565]WUC02390.1 hypothetical protein OG874_37640 [Nocardia sp. NBC_00565]
MRNGQAGRCIFCGSTGLSKEDIWPRWIRRATSHPGGDSSSQLITHAFITDAAAVLVPEHRQRQGPTTSRKVRKVCRNHCNGGWMSRLETAAMPLLLPMIKDTPNCVLSVADQETVARWAVKTSIMMQFTDESTKTSHPDDDIAFYHARKALSMNRVWLGRHEGTRWDRRHYHANADISDATRRQIIDKWGTTTFVADRLVVLVLWDPPGLLSPLFPYSSETVCVWPAVKEVVWPPAGTFTDEALQQAALWVHRAAGRAIRSRGQA